VSWGFIPRVPKAKLKKEMRREKPLDDVAEAKLMPFLRQGHPRDCARYRYAEHFRSMPDAPAERPHE
jgi:hypothetical protein